VADGRESLAAGEAVAAAESFRTAERLWEGRPLADLEFEPFARVDVERLEEHRLLVVEDLIDAELARGLHAAVIPELEALVMQHPLRERLRGQLMLALYRNGRQADALATFHDTRDHLVEDLGLEPTASLRELQQAILRQDPSLDLPSSVNGSPPVATVISIEPPTEAEHERPSASPGAARARGYLRTPVVVAAAVTIALVVFGIVVFRGSDATGGLLPADVHANAIVSAAPDDGKLVQQTDVPGRPTALAAGDGALWATDEANDRVLKLDPATNRIEDQVGVDHQPRSIIATPGAVWVANSGSGTVSRIDPDAGTVVATASAGNVPTAIAAGFGAIWVADATDGTLRRIDPRSDGVVDGIELGQPLTAVAVGLGSVWVASAPSGLVFRVDPRTDEPVQTISVGNDPGSIVVFDGAVWVSTEPDDAISRIDPDAGTVRKVAIARPGALAAVGRRLWVAQTAPDELVALGASGGEPEPATALPTGAPVASLAADGGRLVFATQPTAGSHRGGTLRIAGGDDLDSVDPGVAWSASGWQLLALTNDGLLTYARSPGSAGAVVVPDLAVSLPTVRDGGRAFTFRLRRGVSYSNGAPVRAMDIREAIEREYRAGTGLAAIGVPIVGSSRCSHSHCDLSRGIMVGTDARTITFRLTAADPSFLYKLALPWGDAVPAGSPRIGAAKTIAATGPYRIARYVEGREVVLVRNERFRVWSRTAQPAGFPDRIVVRLRLDAARQAAAVSTGRADATLDTPPAPTLARLRITAPLQLHSAPTPEVDAVFLNTMTSPFDRPAAREAVALAVDRAKVLAIVGGPDVAQPTCQILPQGFPGYRPTCPYTANPNGAGVWRGPDFARARRLVDQSGTAAERVTVSTVASDPQKLAIGRYFVGLLRTLGYRSSLRVYPDNRAFYTHGGSARAKSQLGVVGWIADYESASSFFKPLFTCSAYAQTGPVNTNTASFCHRRIDALIAHANSLEATNSAAANVEWSQVDQEITAQAPWIPLVNPITVDYVSRRVGDYQRHPVFGLLLDRLWVR
jgi:peptide/nickel transport system substrate-binding protein